MSPAATLSVPEASQAALLAADDLFYKRGVAAVTVSEIRDKSGVSLRRLYAMFPAKADLVSAWLRHRHEEWLAGFAALVDDRIVAGDEPIDAVFSALEAWMIETDFRGCGFINTHAESGELTDEQRTIIRTHKLAVASYLETLTTDGRAVAIIVDGAIVQAAIFGDAEPIHHAHRAAVALTTRKLP